MFRPNCRAILRLIFEQVQCTTDNAFNHLGGGKPLKTIFLKFEIGDFH